MFSPRRRRGLFIQSIATFLLIAAGGSCLYLAFQQPVGAVFALLSLVSLFFFAPVPLLIYRIYALANSEYTLERDGMRLRWGLHAEDIPILEIEWVRPATDLVLPLASPRFSWPGALLGVVVVPDLGAVEFMASEWGTLLLIATSAKIYAISPADPNGFLKAFRHTIEMGSISTLPQRTARPAMLLRRIWNDRPARILIAGGLAFSLLVFLAVGLSIDSRSTIPLGFGSNGQPTDPVPADQALLLPFLAVTAFSLDFFLGLFSYYRQGGRPIALLLWLGGLVGPLTFFIAVWFIL
jgi:hypothetical protein